MNVDFKCQDHSCNQTTGSGSSSPGSHKYSENITHHEDDRNSNNSVDQKPSSQQKIDRSNQVEQPQPVVKFAGIRKVPSNKWQVRVSVRGKHRYVGLFDTLDEAKLAHQEVRDKYPDLRRRVNREKYQKVNRGKRIKSTRDKKNMHQLEDDNNNDSMNQKALSAPKTNDSAQVGQRQSIPKLSKITKKGTELTGVRKVGERWTAQVSYNHTREYIGTFATKELATMAYEVARKAFPDQRYRANRSITPFDRNKVLAILAGNDEEEVILEPGPPRKFKRRKAQSIDETELEDESEDEMEDESEDESEDELEDESEDEMDEIKPKAVYHGKPRKCRPIQSLEETDLEWIVDETEIEDTKTKAKYQATTKKRRTAQQVDELCPIDPVEDATIVAVTKILTDPKISRHDVVFGGTTATSENTPEFQNQARNYVNARKEDKFDIVFNLMQSVQAKGGRFLYQPPKDKKLWFHLGDSDSYNMILYRFHRAKIPKTRDNLVLLDSVNDADVIAPGRNAGTFTHPGSVAFIALVKQFVPAFKVASLIDRLQICDDLIRLVQKTKGRFLAIDKVTGLWYEQDSAEAQNRCFSALQTQLRYG